MDKIPVQIHPELRKWRYIDSFHMIAVQLPNSVRRIYRQRTLSRHTLNSCKIAFVIGCVVYIGIQKKLLRCSNTYYGSY